MGIMWALTDFSILKEPYDNFIILKLLNNIKLYNYKKELDKL